MVPKKFRIAMLNQLRLGPYDRPHQAGPVSQEWLVVERSGPDGEHLRISDATTATDDKSGDAPADLKVRNTIFALLAEPEDGTGRNTQFLMVRHLPLAATVQGTFFPADGSATLALKDGTLAMTAFGRHAHTRGDVEGALVFYDIPRPAPSADGAINWHFTAEERPWIAAT